MSGNTGKHRKALPLKTDIIELVYQNSDEGTDSKSCLVSSRHSFGFY